MLKINCGSIFRKKTRWKCLTWQFVSYFLSPHFLSSFILYLFHLPYITFHGTEPTSCGHNSARRATSLLEKGEVGVGGGGGRDTRDDHNAAQRTLWAAFVCECHKGPRFIKAWKWSSDQFFPSTASPHMSDHTHKKDFIQVCYKYTKKNQTVYFKFT